MQRRPVRLIALLAVIALFAAGCGDDKKDSSSGDTETTEAADANFKKAPTFPAGSTMDKIQKKGKITVGTKFDQEGFGLKNPTTGAVEGFDTDIAELMAAAIFGGTGETVEDKIEFVETVSAVRESSITDGKVDMVVATYTINDARKQIVDFAGPYFEAEQDIMVKKDDTSIKSVKDLNGKKVCSVQGSTSIKNVALPQNAPQADLSIQFKTYSECAEALGDGRVQAVTTDNAILAGLASKSGGAYKLVGAPFSKEPYGIGIKKGDEAFRTFLNDRIAEIVESGEWKDAFDESLGKLGLKAPTPPKVDRYTAGAPAATTTTTAKP